MAKTARLKNSNKAPSTHSRASRRASSPSLNLNLNPPLDKSLTLTSPNPAPRSTPNTNTNTNTNRGNILAPVRSGGVAKGKTKGKILKRKQRLRIEKGKVRAEAVGDKLERRRGVGRRGGGRNADWDELNKEIKGGRGREEGKGGKGDEGWEDEGDMDFNVDVGVDGMGGKVLGGREGVGIEEAVMDGVETMEAVEGEIL